MRPLLLVAINGGKHYPLDKDMILIGRQDICDIHIDHKSVSKQHCVLMVRGNKLWLRDLGSTNGCHVNGKRVRRSLVKLSDVVGVAGFNFRVTSTEAGKKKTHHEDPGTAKLSKEELKRLEHGMVKEASKSMPVRGPVVQVNVLPDEYTQVIEEDDE
ncbi:MAG TPA: FHA domain-containing protein [Gemmatales bacterium]|nr:FHA domain-containing protein [Gemmatales bacterium]